MKNETCHFYHSDNRTFFSTIPKLRQECELRMITDHLDFLHSDCKEMVSQEKRVDLHNMYVLLKPITPDGLKTLIQAFLDHIKNEGIETISTLKGETVCDTINLIVITIILIDSSLFLIRSISSLWRIC